MRSKQNKFEEKGKGKGNQTNVSLKFNYKILVNKGQ